MCSGDSGSNEGPRHSRTCNLQFQSSVSPLQSCETRSFRLWVLKGNIHPMCNSSKHLHIANHVASSEILGIIRVRQVIRDNIQPCPKEIHGLLWSGYKYIITGIYHSVLKSYAQLRVVKGPRRQYLSKRLKTKITEKMTFNLGPEGWIEVCQAENKRKNNQAEETV